MRVVFCTYEIHVEDFSVGIVSFGVGMCPLVSTGRPASAPARRPSTVATVAYPVNSSFSAKRPSEDAAVPSKAARRSTRPSGAPCEFASASLARLAPTAAFAAWGKDGPSHGAGSDGVGFGRGFGLRRDNRPAVDDATGRVQRSRARELPPGPPHPLGFEKGASGAERGPDSAFCFRSLQVVPTGDTGHYHIGNGWKFQFSDSVGRPGSVELDPDIQQRCFEAIDRMYRSGSGSELSTVASSPVPSASVASAAFASAAFAARSSTASPSSPAALSRSASAASLSSSAAALSTLAAAAAAVESAAAAADAPSSRRAPSTAGASVEL